MVRIIIKTSRKYANYLSEHLQKEHPKTKGKIRVRG